MLPGAFPDRVNPDIDYPGEAVVQCDIAVEKIIYR